MATRYLVLREITFPVGQGSPTRTAYERVGEAEAPSARAAITKVAASRGDDAAGVYAAVPERSFTRESVRVETTPRVLLGDAEKKPPLREATTG